MMGPPGYWLMLGGHWHLMQDPGQCLRRNIYRCPSMRGYWRACLACFLRRFLARHSFLFNSPFPFSSRSDPSPSHRALVDDDHFTVVPCLAPVANTPRIVTLGLPLLLKISAETLTREPDHPPCLFPSQSPAISRSTGPSICIHPFVVPLPVSLSPAFPMVTITRIRSMSVVATPPFSPSDSDPLSDDSLSLFLPPPPRPHRRRRAARCTSSQSAWSCRSARVKFPVRRGILHSVRDKLDSPSHLLLFFPFHWIYYRPRHHRLRQSFPSLLSFIRRSCLSLCCRFVAVVGAFSGGGGGLQVGLWFLWWFLVFCAWLFLFHLVGA